MPAPPPPLAWGCACVGVAACSCGSTVPNKPLGHAAAVNSQPLVLLHVLRYVFGHMQESFGVAAPNRRVGMAAALPQHCRRIVRLSGCQVGPQPPCVKAEVGSCVPLAACFFCGLCLLSGHRVCGMPCITACVGVLPCLALQHIAEPRPPHCLLSPPPPPPPPRWHHQQLLAGFATFAATSLHTTHACCQLCT